MDIRKTDSKGRLTGFPKSAYYSVVRTPEGRVIVEPLKPEHEIHLPLPVNKNTQDYLETLGLNLREISVDGVSREGYDRMVKGTASRVRETWPDGFDFDHFLSLLYGRAS